ncbi:hypothetical protein [Mesorhizobium marinum]|uniref:hypothetical protein n=1 Tax=Mesorhizobium marinum TaxID=3228790 RepID=UPI0034679141
MTLSPALRRAAEESKAKFAEPLRDEPTLDDLQGRIEALESEKAELLREVMQKKAKLKESADWRKVLEAQLERRRRLIDRLIETL